MKDALDRTVDIGLSVRLPVHCLDDAEQLTHQPVRLATIIRDVDKAPGPNSGEHGVDASYFFLGWHLVEDQSRDDLVKLAEGSCIMSKAVATFDLDSGSSGLCLGCLDHRRIWIEANDSRSRRPALEHDREGSGAASDVEDRLPVLRRDLLEQELAPALLPSEQADREIIKRSKRGMTERWGEFCCLHVDLSTWVRDSYMLQ